METTFFNAHHAPIGAFSTFTLGFRGNKGGFGSEIRQPANQSIYIGMETSPNRFQALPFYKNAESEATLYDIEGHSSSESSAQENEKILTPFSDVQRSFHLCTDTFTAGDLKFTIYNQVISIPDPASSSEKEVKDALIPAVWFELSIDNTDSPTPRRAFIGYELNSPTEALRSMFSSSASYRNGIGRGHSIALVTDAPDAIAAIGFTMEDILRQKIRSNAVFGLGTHGALLLDVPAGQCKTYRFAACFFHSGLTSAVLDCTYYYTRFFSSIDEVASYAMADFDFFKNRCISGNALLEANHLSQDQRFMMAQSIRSYYGSTELLLHNQEPLWIVNEGEYRMMNTFDLMADQLFYEMKMNPWTVKNELDLYVSRYNYEDSVHFPGDSVLYDGGISFTHDMGARNTFSPSHRSAYEQSGTSGCHSYMTQEQLVNWICCGAVYYVQTQDNAWLSRQLPVFIRCFQSMLHRDHPNADKRTGIMKLDSSFVMDGAEITTYDSLDASLGQARNNIYLAGKCWAAYLSLEKIFHDTGHTNLAKEASLQAQRCAATLCHHMTPEGYIPAVIDEENTSRIIPAIEGLIFPYFSGRQDALDPSGPYSSYLKCLKQHILTILTPGVCLFPDGGWKLSSTSNNSWLSKIYLCQFIAHHLLKLPRDSSSAMADSAHVSWLLHTTECYWAWSDQIVSGIPRGSRYYPRGVSSILWLLETSPD